MTGARLATIDRGSGSPVLLLHGQPGDGASWSRVTDRLVGRHRVLAPDRPGYGSTTLDAMGMAANADLMADLLRRRGAAPATVVGHSWAGGVAVLMAARHPGVVRSLVLAGSVGTPDSVNGLDRLLVAGRLGDALTAVGILGIGMVLPRLRAGSVAQRGRPASRSVGRGLRHVASWLPDEVLPGGWSGAWGRSRSTFAAEQFALMDELPAVGERLGGLAVPTTVVVGEWDMVVPPPAARSLAAAIPGARLVRLPEVGHFLARDAAGDLADVIASTDAEADCGPMHDHRVP